MKEKIPEKIGYTSQTAQIIQSIGDLLGNVKDKMFLFSVILIAIFGFILYKSAILFTDSLNNLSVSISNNTEKINNLTNIINKSVMDTTKQESNQEILLTGILNELKNSKNKKDNYDN